MSISGNCKSKARGKQSFKECFLILMSLSHVLNSNPIWKAVSIHGDTNFEKEDIDDKVCSRRNRFAQLPLLMDTEES